MRHPWSIARRIAVVHVLLVAVVALFGGWAAWVQSRDVAATSAERHVAGVAAVVSRAPEVVDALRSADGAAALQGRIAHWTGQADVSWMTVMDTAGVRVASWAPQQVGVRYPAPIDRALAGQSWTEVSTTGPAGRSVRALVPVRDPDTGEVLGVLTMGVPVDRLAGIARAQLPGIVLTAALTALAGLAVAGLLARYLHRVTLGHGPEEVAEQFLLAETTMDALDVGIVVLSPAGGVRLANDAALRLLDLDPGTEPGGTPRLPAALATALAESADAEITLPVAGRVLVVQRHRVDPRRAAGRTGTGAGRTDARAIVAAAREGVDTAPSGTLVLTLHDRTDLLRLGDELTVAHTLTSALRAQTHEHANQLHTALSLVEAGRLESAKAVLSRHERPGQDSEDVVIALLAAKAAQARERGVALEHRVGLARPAPLDALDLITVVGNLVDNALEAAGAPEVPEADRWVDVEVGSGAEGLVVQVADGGPGPAPEDAGRLFERGWSTKPAGPAGRGVGLWLVRRIAEQAGGTVELATDSGTVVTLEVPAREAVRRA